GKDYGPLKNVIKTDDIHLIQVRYYDNKRFKNIQEVQSYLNSVLHSEQGSTMRHIFWDEGLPVVTVEATIIFKSGERTKWLLAPHRSVIQDVQLRWWFNYVPAY
ncbi:MAG: hypothetical protein WCD45_06170, partial [Gallionella sp.]